MGTAQTEAYEIAASSERMEITASAEAFKCLANISLIKEIIVSILSVHASEISQATAIILVQCGVEASELWIVYPGHTSILVCFERSWCARFNSSHYWNAENWQSGYTAGSKRLLGTW